MVKLGVIAGVVIVFLFFWHAAETFCPQEPQILGNNSGIIIPKGDRCLLYFPGKPVNFLSNFFFIDTGDKKYIFFTRPHIYIGRIQPLVQYRTMPYTSAQTFLERQSFLLTFLLTKKNERLRREIEDLENKIKHAQLVLLDPGKKFLQVSRGEIEVLSKLAKETQRLLSELNNLHKNIEAYLRVQPELRHLLSLKLYGEYLSFGPKNVKLSGKNLSHQVTLDQFLNFIDWAANAL